MSATGESTKEVQIVQMTSRVRTGMIDKNSYHLKYTHNCVCQRIAFAGFQTIDIDIVYSGAIVFMSLFPLHLGFCFVCMLSY